MGRPPASSIPSQGAERPITALTTRYWGYEPRCPVSAKDFNGFGVILPRLALRRTGYGSGCDMPAATKLSAHPKVIASSSNSQSRKLLILGRSDFERNVMKP